MDWLNEAPQVKLSIDPDRANLAGAGNSDIAKEVLAATDGVQVTTLRSGDKQVPVVARLEENERANLSDLHNFYVPASEGSQKVPLLSVARLQTDLTVQRIRRRDHFRTIGVHTWPFHGVLSSEVLQKAQLELDKLQKSLPPGYRLVIGGEQAKQEDGFANLAIVLLISIAGIYVTLLLQFKNAI